MGLSKRCFFAVLVSLLVPFAASAQKWERVGPSGGMVISLAAGTGEAVYLGTADGHVFAKDDPKKPWELRGRVGTRTDTVVSRLLADPGREGAVFAAVWYQQPGAGGGIFRSEDGGRTWELLGLKSEAVRALEMAASQPSVLVAGTRSGIFRSRDAGKSWDQISPQGDAELRNLDSLAIDPRDANIIYAGTYHLPWKTVDGGKTWRPVVEGLIDDSDIMSLRVDASNPDRIFLSACSGIYRSENQGASWTKLQGIPYAARRTQAIVQDPANPRTLYAGTTEGLWVTQDAGESWDRATPADWVINSVAVEAGGAQGKERVLVGTEIRGVQVSEDAVKTLHEDNDGFRHEVVRQLIRDPRDAAHLAMLMERNGAILWESGDGGRLWQEIPVATASNGQRERKKDALFAPESVERLYASPWGWMARLFNGQLWLIDEGEEKWREWKLQLPLATTTKVNTHSADAVQTPRASSGARAANPASLNVADGRIFEFSRDRAFVSTREGLMRCNPDGKCVRLKGFGHVGESSAAIVSADGLDLAVVADGKLATSGDGGQSAVWSDLPAAVDDVLWIGRTERQGQPKLFLGTSHALFESADGGASWRRCQQGLPAGQVERLLEGDGYLAVTLREGGLYVSRDTGTTWSREDQDDQRSRFTGLAETAPGILTIGSQSEGVLRWKDKPGS